MSSLTKNEKKVLYGVTRYPAINDSELAILLDVKLSTLTSIKRRLSTEAYYRTHLVPLVNRLGWEMLAVMYTQFNPVIPLEDRIETTKRTIEVFDEIFFSVGEEEKGFSMSLSQNYTNIGRINEIRTETFGQLGLLEKEYPHEVIMPFETSQIHRFFDFTRLLHHLFELNEEQTTPVVSSLFQTMEHYRFSPKEKKVFITLIQYPEETTQQIGERTHLSRHTIARMKKHFLDIGLLQYLTLPNLEKLGIEILTLYHIRFNPHKAPNANDLTYLDSPSTVFFASRKFEAVQLAAYPSYQEYKADEMRKIRFLKENTLIVQPPFISPYMFGRLVLIKEFNFTPVSRKILSSSD